MKTSFTKILPVFLLLVSFSAISQDSLAVTSKCDSLKAIYEMKLKEWDEVETNLKTLYEKYKNYNDSNIERYKSEYDSLVILYNSRWETVKSENLKYLKCSDQNADNSNYLPPPPPPPPLISNFEIFPDVQNKPELIQDTVELIRNYIKENYPDKAKKYSLRGAVIVDFIISLEEGIPTNLSIRSEIPDSLGFGAVALEAIKLLRWKPFKDSRTGVRCQQRIIFEPPIKDSE